MRILYSFYTLVKKKKINSVDQNCEQAGALVKLIDEKGHWGVADLCPWPTLGDRDLFDEIRTKGILFQRSIELAKEDLLARRSQKSLLQNKWIQNNVLVTDFYNFDFLNPLYVGKTFKIKGNSDTETLLKILNSTGIQSKIRIDFNGALNPEKFSSFIENLASKEMIEYIEDPTAYDPHLWNDWNRVVPLAADFIKAPDHFSYKIIKPSREPVQNYEKFSITSSMDHPVGIAHALRYAQIFAQRDSGLMTLDLYEPTEFNKYFIDQNRTELNFSSMALNDVGIGMTNELISLKWEE